MSDPNHPHDEPEIDTTPARDPRLEIPEILRTPVRQSQFDPVVGSKEGGAKKEAIDTAGMGRAWAMALDFVFTVLAGALVGYLLDRWQGWLPIGTLVGLVLGFVSGFIRIIRATQRQERLEKERRGK
jgi:F0F1-type ATP synthase assembly protein I